MKGSPRPVAGVLGVWDGHDASVAIVAQGRLLFALSEERPSRRKRYSGFPALALARALAFARGEGIELTDIALAGSRGRAPLRILEPWYAGSDPQRDPLNLPSRLVRTWENHVGRVPLLGRLERTLGLAALRTRLPAIAGSALALHTVPHHDAHAWSALLLDPAPTDWVLTWDAYGEGLAATLRAAGDPSRPIAVLPPSAGLASLYGAVTHALGFGEGDEGKVMGLAARGDPTHLRARFAALCGADPALPLLLHPLDRAALRHLVADAPREDVAAALQEFVELKILGWLADQGRRHPGSRRLLLAGGLFANIRVNQALARAPGIDGVAVFANMGDGGLSAGAAHAVWSRAHATLAEPMRHPLLGVAFAPDELLRAVQASGLPHRHLEDAPRAAAERLLRGEVVCLFGGRDEFGPRALGNRSILFDAAKSGLPERVNQALGRDGFMPFGPAVLDEETPRAWNAVQGTDLETMTVAVDASPTFAARCPSAVHLDGTTRPQVVRARTAPILHAVLSHFRAQGGAPAVINTSLNLHGEPIVHTPTDALDTFARAGLGALYLGDLEVTQR